jgi:hypothetical protein
MGRPPIGKAAMTGAERVRRYRLARRALKLAARIRDLEAALATARKDLAAAKRTRKENRT